MYVTRSNKLPYWNRFFSLGTSMKIWLPALKFFTFSFFLYQGSGYSLDILSENSSHFVSCLACNNIYFLLSLREVMCWTNTKNEGLCFPISCMIVFSLKDTRLPHATLAGQAAGIYFSFTILHTYFVVYLLYKTQLQYFCYIVTLSYT